MKNKANRLQAARLAKDLTQVDLAERSGVSLAYIRMIEQGVRSGISKDIKLKIAEALGVRIDEIFLEERRTAWDDFLEQREADKKIFESIAQKMTDEEYEWLVETVQILRPKFLQSDYETYHKRLQQLTKKYSK